MLEFVYKNHTNDTYIAQGRYMALTVTTNLQDAYHSKKLHSFKAYPSFKPTKVEIIKGKVVEVNPDETLAPNQDSYKIFKNNNEYLYSVMGNKNLYLPSLDDFINHNIQIMTYPYQPDNLSNNMVSAHLMKYDSVEEFILQLPNYTHLYQITHFGENLEGLKVRGAIKPTVEDKGTPTPFHLQKGRNKVTGFTYPDGSHVFTEGNLETLHTLLNDLDEYIQSDIKKENNT